MISWISEVMFDWDMLVKFNRYNNYIFLKVLLKKYQL